MRYIFLLFNALNFQALLITINDVYKRHYTISNNLPPNYFSLAKYRTLKFIDLLLLTI